MRRHPANSTGSTARTVNSHGGVPFEGREVTVKALIIGQVISTNVAVKATCSCQKTKLSRQRTTTSAKEVKQFLVLVHRLPIRPKLVNDSDDMSRS